MPTSNHTPSHRIQSRTDVGVRRTENEDSLGFQRAPSLDDRDGGKGALCVVADGMGGHDAGGLASRTAVDMVLAHYYGSSASSPREALEEAIRKANERILEIGEEEGFQAGMGTTLVAATALADRLLVANLGDSRCYLLRDEELERLTEDHSWVREQVRMGALSEEEAERHPRKNIITRSLGLHGEIDVEFFEKELRVGDQVILCSDGLWGMVGDGDMREVLSQDETEKALDSLVELANERGGPDNISVVRLIVLSVAMTRKTTDAETESANKRKGGRLPWPFSRSS